MRNALEVIVQAAMLAVLALAVPLYRLALPTTLRARWLRVVRPIEYDFFSNNGDHKGRIMPGLVGERYLTLCAGSERVRDLIAAGDVLVTTESYDAPAVSTIFHYHMWPNDHISKPPWQPLY